MLRDGVTGGKGHDRQPRQRAGRRRGMTPHLGRESVPALVDGLDALFRFKPRAQRRQALGYAVGSDMHIAPKRLPELQGRHNLAVMRQQQPERGKLLGRQVNHRLAAHQRAIGLQPESSK